MNKSAASRAGALGIEALVGSVLGSGVGLTGGAYTWEPDTPKEWTDETGRVYSRKLTQDEKQQRARYLARAALMGTLGGAVAGPGVSTGRRALQGATEARVAKETAEPYLHGLREVSEELQRRAQFRPVPGGAKPAPGSIRQTTKRKAELAQKLLRAEETKLTQGLLGTASKERGKAPFGGPFTGVVRKATRAGEKSRAEWSPRTHEGQIAGYLEGLRKTHDLGEGQLANKRFWRNYVESVFEKRSSVLLEAFMRETSTLCTPPPKGS
jgi:hypothetical protein